MDVWHHLDDATQQLAAVHRADLNTTVEVRRVRREMDRLAATNGSGSTRAPNGSVLSVRT
jgi:arginine decarboxylase